MIADENKVFLCIQDNTDVTDTVLKKKLCTDDFDKDALYEAIDSLLVGKKIERTYPEESQVAVYITC
jgi:hypothetical protein